MNNNLDENSLHLEWANLGGRYFTNESEFVSVSTKSTSRRLYISTQVAKKYLEDYKFAQIGFDVTKKVMAIKPTTENSLEVVRFFNDGSKKTKAKSISSKALVEKIKDIAGQKDETLVRYPVKWSEKFNSLLVDLNNPLLIESEEEENNHSKQETFNI